MKVKVIKTGKHCSRLFSICDITLHIKCIQEYSKLNKIRFIGYIIHFIIKKYNYHEIAVYTNVSQTRFAESHSNFIPF